MKLGTLLKNTAYKSVRGSTKAEISSLVYDSRKVEEGSLFVCIKGAGSDGHDYIDEAAAKGAAAIVAEREPAEELLIPLILVKSSRRALAELSAAWFGHPARKLTLIGITGTKGKTTTSCMIRSMLEHSGYKTGLIGTLGIIIGDERRAVPNTTPESYVIEEALKEMAERGCSCAVMEVSSQALMLNRTAGLYFDYGVFTNLSRDHIGENEHSDMDDYIRCKNLLFKQCRVGIFNFDDPYFPDMLKGHSCSVETYGCSADAMWRASEIRFLRGEGMIGMSCHISGKTEIDIEVPLPGKFSIYNALASLVVCAHFGVKPDVITDAVGAIHVPGRAELISISPKFTLMIDYAHNAVSLESLLLSLREYKPRRLVALFGCGGNRSKERRYDMGEVSSRLADLSIITSDNPRFEEPSDIISDIIIGVKKADGEYVVVESRAEAIRYAIEHAMEGDIIVLAGKGHEDYQEIRGKKYHMDERELIADVVKDGHFIR